MTRRLRIISFLAAAAWLAQPGPLRACAACYGQSDSPMARGMNWGIFTLLAVVVCVLSAFATFFVFLARKSATVSGGKPDVPSQEPTPKL